jgi:hypothetical protein
MLASKWIVCFFAAAALGFGQRVQGEIPFAFQTANETFPPGAYVMEINLGTRLVFITPKGSQQQGCVLAMVGTRKGWSAKDPDYSLVFRKYGDQYFLAQVHHSGVTATVVPSRSERELQADPLAIQAKRAPVTVTIAARLVK